MTLFERGTGLELLGEAYALRGGVRAPAELDIHAPITLVHDVSRIITLGTGVVGRVTGAQHAPFPGYFNTTHGIEITANGTDTPGSFTIASVLQLALDSTDNDYQGRYRAWLCEVSGRGDPNLTITRMAAYANEGAARTGAAAAGEGGTISRRTT